MNSSYKEEGKGQWFEYKQGDIIINYPPKEESGLQEGFFAVYRKENNEWKIVAGQ